MKVSPSRVLVGRWGPAGLGVLLILGSTLACANPGSGPVAAKDPALKELLDMSTEGLAPEVGNELRQALAAVQRNLAPAGDDSRAVGQALGELAMSLHRYERVLAARNAYELAASRLPDDYRWPYLLGQLEREHGDLQSASTALGQAARLRPGFLPAILGLAETQLEMGQLQAAQEGFTQTLQLDPACAPALAGLAKVALARQQADIAIGHLQRALSLQPDADALHHLLARAWRLQGDEEQARQALQLAGRRQPETPDALLAAVVGQRQGVHNELDRAQEALLAGRIREAEHAYRDLVARHPEVARAWINLGGVLARQGRSTEAARVLERAVALAPQDPLAQFNLGTVQLAEGRLEEAARHLESARELRPQQTEILLNLAQVRRLLGATDLARQHYDELLKLDPGSAPGHLGSALLRWQLGDPAVARGELEDALAHVPAHPGLIATLARLLATAQPGELRDGRRALRLVRSAQDAARPRNSDLRRTEAMALAEVGQFREAVAITEQLRAQAVKQGEGELALQLEQEARSYARGCPWRLVAWDQPAPDKDSCGS